MKKITFFNLLALLILSAGCGGNKARPADPLQGAAIDDCGVITRMNPDEKKVYLVFTAHYSRNDDGYFENFDGIVPVLDVLKEKEVKGSFFPTGECFRVEKYQEPLKRIIQEGHYLSAHSNKHLLLCPEDDHSINLVTADSIAKDISGMEAELNKLGLSKKDYSWMIPPYENYNEFSAGVLRELGYTLINPTPGFLTGLDWAPEGAPNFIDGDTIVNGIWDIEKKEGLNGVILLVHAMHYPDRKDVDRTYTRLGEIIDGLKERGYAFGSIKDLI